MGIGYQRRDIEIVDYKLWSIQSDSNTYILRGPQAEKLDSGKYFSSVGAANTFGCYVQKPYTAILEEKLKLTGLNLGFGGIGPEFFNNPKNTLLLKLINNSKFAIIAIMSGRSQSNSIFQTLEHTQEKYVDQNGKIIPADLAYERLLRNYSVTQVKNIVAETRRLYIEEYIKFLSKIKVPKILLWQSRRSPDYTESYESIVNLFRGFPQLVNREMVNNIKLYCDDYVESYSETGIPQLLISRFTAKPAPITRFRGNGANQIKEIVTHNRYYPSPEMHKETASLLYSVCQKYI